MFRMYLRKLKEEISRLQGEYYNENSVQPEPIRYVCIKLKGCLESLDKQGIAVECFASLEVVEEFKLIIMRGNHYQRPEMGSKH